MFELRSAQEEADGKDGEMLEVKEKMMKAEIKVREMRPHSLSLSLVQQQQQQKQQQQQQRSPLP